MYESLMIFTAHLPVSDEYEQFVETVIERSKDEFNTSYDKSDVNIMLTGFHDSILLYGQVLSEILLEDPNSDPISASDITWRVWNRTFSGKIEYNFDK